MVTSIGTSCSHVLAVELGHLDAEEVRHDVEGRPEPEEQDLPAEGGRLVAVSDQLDQQDGERADGGEAAGDRQGLAGDDVGVEEDEAADEDLDDDEVAQSDVDDPPQVGSEPERELAGRADHVAATEVERKRQQPQHDERGGDRSFDEALAGIEETGNLVWGHGVPPAMSWLPCGCGRVAGWRSRRTASGVDVDDRAAVDGVAAEAPVRLGPRGGLVEADLGGRERAGLIIGSGAWARGRFDRSRLSSPRAPSDSGRSRG